MDIKVPVLPESIEDGTIAVWYKSSGNKIARDEVIVEIETDKVILEVRAEADGIMGEIFFKAGDLVKSNQILCNMELIEGKETNTVENNLEETQDESDSDASVINESEESVSKLTSPAVRKIMEENGIAIEDVVGTGKNGRILKEDVLTGNLPLSSDPLKSDDLNDLGMASVSNIDHSEITENHKRVTNTSNSSESRNIYKKPMSRLRMRIADKLLEATQSTAMLTTFNELDMQSILDIRKKYKDEFVKSHGIKLGFMSFFVKASVEALKKFPAVNAKIEGEDIVYHDFYDVGVAVSSNRGLVVPILRDSQNMSLSDIEKNIASLVDSANSGKLELNEITGGTFTISNGGIFGSMLSTPILNTPQSAVLGMHKIEQRPVVVDGEIVIRPIMYLALSYDHRIIDGREAVLFLRSIKESLEDPSRLLLDL